MWKKLSVGIFAMIVCITVGYAYYNPNMNASTTSFTLQKGQKVVMGTYKGKKLVWDIGNTANDYVFMTSTLLEDNVTIYDASDSSLLSTCKYYLNTTFNKSYASYCPLTLLKQKIANIALTSEEANISLKGPFIPTLTELKTGGALGLNPADRAFKVDGNYWVDGVMLANGYGGFPTNAWLNVRQLGMNWQMGAPNPPYTDYGDGNTFNPLAELMPVSGPYSVVNNGTSNPTIYDIEAGIRPYLIVDKTRINFAAYPAYTDGNWHAYDIDTSNFNAKNELNPTKLRVASSLTADLQDLKSNANSLQKIVKNSVVDVQVNANTGSNTKMSVLIYDNTGANIKYYRMITNTINGVHDYHVDLTGIPTGKYQLAVINEEYDSASNLPAESSAISNQMPLEIVDPHKITYTKTPQSGATIGDYEYGKNVNAGQDIGQIAVISQGVMPLTYTIESNGDNTYQNFEIDGLDVNGTSNASTLNVKVKSNAPNLKDGGLIAGTYKFCIIAKDANGYPAVPDASSNTKACTSLQVEKTNSTVSFTDPNQTTIKIGDSDIKETITTDHGELALSGLGAAIYTISGGVSGTGLTITRDPSNPKGFTIAIGTSTSAILPATFTLTVKTPTTTNCIGSTASKHILVFKEISALDWFPKISGNYGTSDVTANKVVGELLAIDGLENYTYALAQPGDSGYSAADAVNNADFIVDGSAKKTGIKAEVKAATSLGAGTYKIQFKVTDGNGDEQYKSVQIVVAANTQPPLEFKEDGSTITKKTIYYDDTNEYVQAQGGLSSILTPPTYALSDNQISGVNAGDYLAVDNTSGQLTPKKITQPNKPIKVKATKAGNATYSAVSAEIEITILPAKQTIAFDNSDNPRKIKLSDTGASETAQGTLTSVGNKGSGIGGITYTSSDPSIAQIDVATGAITPKKAGTVTITATLNDPAGSSYDANYETATVSKQVYIYEGMVLTFTESNPRLKANDTAKANAAAGIVHATNNSGALIYAISSDSTANNIDAGMFTIDVGGTLKLKQDIKASDLLIHGIGNPYKVRIDVTDNNGTQSIDVEVHIEEADNDFYFVDPDNPSQKINEIVKDYVANGTFPLATHTSNGGTVTYQVKSGANQGIVSVSGAQAAILKTGTTIIEATVAAGSGYSSKTITIPVNIKTIKQDFMYTDSYGNELPKTGNAYRAIEEVYARGETFQLYTSGNPSGTNVTYALKSGSPKDVIDVNAQSGLVTILNASLPIQVGKVIVQATSHDPNGNYADNVIEIPINITKADQTVSFQEVINVISGKGNVTPVINAQDISSNDGGVTLKDSDYYISVDSSISSSIAKTSDGKTISYNYSGGNGLDIPLHVVKQGNRNYNMAEANGKIHIMGLDESVLVVSDVGDVVYGDQFSIRSLQDDSGSTNVQYTFEIDDTTYISKAAQHVNSADLQAVKASGNKTITITITRTADGEKPLSVKKTIKVLPKEIEIIIDDKAKYKGEANPTLTYQDFKSQLVSWNGVQDVIQEKDIKLNTAAQTNSPAGSYPIHGDANSLNSIYPNYSFKFADGTLTIKEDNIEDDWYHMEIADGSHTPYRGDWTNQDVDIISDHTDYVNLSLDQSTWKPQKATVSKEGESNQSFWMKKNSGATTKEKQEIIRIDKTPPKVKGIKAKDSNNQLQDIINKLSGGIFFQPGTAFEITTSDENGSLKVSGTEKISYKVFKITDSNKEEVKNGTLSVTNDKASITISETIGTYQVCVIPTDHADNSNTESCHEVTLKKLEVDVDGDGEPDFNDPDGDGCPDLNIKWKDPNDSTKWIVINGDRDNDGIPDLNIDSDGDVKPDLNVDTDHDGKPDLNLVILKKSDWKPTKCVKQDITNGILEEYCTGTTVKPVINVDLDGDGIPDINIDNKGDFKPHLNVSKDGKKPYLNIVALHEWKPKKDYQSGKFTYDSIGKDDAKREINIDTDDDGLPDVNIDLDGDGIPDLNIDGDGDEIPDVNIDSNGDGKPDFNIDVSGNGYAEENIIELTEWKPTQNAHSPYEYDTMEILNPNDPQNPGTDKPDNQGNEKPSDQITASDDNSVKGNYHSQESMGGASTGDTTNLMLYLFLTFMTLGILEYLLFKKINRNR